MQYLGDGYGSKSLYAHEPVLTAERRPWRGVLQQAYADAELPLGVDAEDELFVEQIRARRYLRADAPDEAEELKLVCDYADVPFDRVVTWARKHYTPASRRHLQAIEAKDAKEVKEIVKAIGDREASRHRDSSEPFASFPSFTSSTFVC